MNYQFYTVKEFAGIMRISLPTAYKALNAGEVHSIRVAGRRLVPKAEIERLAKENKS